MLKVFLLLALAFMPSVAWADVWTATREWDDAEETRFSEWIERLPLDVFTRPGSPYQGISTDCADAVYVLRILFAYERGLPVAFPSRRALTNTNKDFDATPAGMPRLKKFLSFVRKQTSTKSLVFDTYPVEINRGAIRPGILFLHPEGGEDVPLTYRAGHVYYVQRLFENGMIRFFSSTVPSAVRDLQPRIDIIFAPFGETGGYRAWKRPGSSARPGESQQQFTIARWKAGGYRDWNLWQRWHDDVRKRLALRPATAKEEFEAALENVRGYIHERARLVATSWSVYERKYGGYGCMNESDYDSYSTPTRDVKIQSELEVLRAAARRYTRDVPALFEQYRFPVMADGTKASLNQLWQAFHTDTVLSISEPEHSPAVRWGFRPQGRWPCPERAKNYVGGDRIQTN